MTQDIRLLYFITEDWYFCSHRLALARAAQQSGYQVTVLTRVNRHGDIIRSQGFNLIPLDIERGGTNPVRELRTVYKVWQIYAQVKPDIVHHVALKPVLYGSLASLFISNIKSVNLIAGLGAIFSSQKLKVKLLKSLVKFSLKSLFQSSASRVIVQNIEDRDLLNQQFGINASRVVLIKGSGVDTQKYYPVPEPAGKVRVALVSRLLWDKGIGEFVAAVRILKQRKLEFSAILAGEPDNHNLASVSRSQLQEWHDDGLISWLGYQDNIAEFWHDTHIAVLPSYREGLPKSLLEAAACGRPIVTTDTSGCKEIVQNGVNGFLVPVRDANGLADALEKLILNTELRQKMGQAGREMVKHMFSDEIIIAETLKVYRELL
ncbi:MAG: glycosyltransferase family 4 protein [Methylomonas sp.]